ncbi:Predicted phosphohydrolase or phosphomutase, AlkP superfamily [Natronorubrum sediminis]|uniref:Predicted phosphohydrolase or phosphomutase, AlkP superfamily n=1 Tax=Natronorubrum sediminis TaxID=640943 RepID=A0A1H6G4S2_9EURY|nr:alkaline phosphatase family protein [Natronorubrum sediminis]SEH18039.1 Predicted phosphohydrolase or phosphomutase, AlkP superfamily [Natronorubrum sediminis]
MDDSTDDRDMQLLVIGLDAGCRSILDPLCEDGKIPTLADLIDRGTSGPLESQIPPWTGSAWPSMYTGKNPGKHGVYDFLSFDGYEWDVVNATYVRERPVWELLSEHGLSSVVVNVPVTHPPREFNGALIPGMTAPEDPPCHPEGILEDVKLACDDYHVYPQSTDAPEQSIEGYERTIECRGEAFQYLCRRENPDFGFVQFQQTDTVFHERPGDKAAIEAVYQAVDEQVADILETTDPKNVLVVSDHGMGKITGTEFRVNEFLRDHGYLEAKKGGEGMPNWSKSWENDLLEGEDAGNHDDGSLATVMNVAAKAGITTQRIANALDTVGLKEPIGRRVPNEMIRAASEQVDFPESKAYVRSKSELGIRINLEGREPNGQVASAEYDEVRQELIDLLSDVTTPDGEAMFEVVAPRELYFDGPHLEDAPDILTVPDDFDNAIVADVGMDHFGEPMEPWNHKQTGFVAATGEDFEEGVPLEEATIFDVAPTICTLFDVPIDVEMDGIPLPVVEGSTEESYPDYEPDPISVTDDDAVEDRLSDLGYL